MSESDPLALALASFIHELSQPIQAAELAAYESPPQLLLLRRALSRASRSLAMLGWLARMRQGDESARAEILSHSVAAALSGSKWPSGHFYVSLPPKLRLLTAPGALETVFSNLLDNARKYAPDAKVSIVAIPLLANTHPSDAQVNLQGERALLTVLDDSPGVPAAFRVRLFEPFSQATAQLEGFGVGLWLCRALARAHGGDLWLDPTQRGASCHRDADPPRSRRGQSQIAERSPCQTGQDYRRFI